MLLQDVSLVHAIWPARTSSFCAYTLLPEAIEASWLRCALFEAWVILWKGMEPALEDSPGVSHGVGQCLASSKDARVLVVTDARHDIRFMKTHGRKN